MKLTANTIIKLFVDAIGQDAFKDFYDFNWEALLELADFSHT